MVISFLPPNGVVIEVRLQANKRLPCVHNVVSQFLILLSECGYFKYAGSNYRCGSTLLIGNLVEQGSTILAEPNDNFRYARRLVGQQLIAFAKLDMIGKPTQVSVKQGGRKAEGDLLQSRSDDARRPKGGGEQHRYRSREGRAGRYTGHA